MSEKTAMQLIDEIQANLSELKELVAPSTTKPDQSAGVIYDKTNNSFHGVRREAKRLGVTPGHLSRYLRGERKSARLLKKVTVKEV
jgi:transcriptional regulator with XRE-family HTH domain